MFQSTQVDQWNKEICQKLAVQSTLRTAVIVKVEEVKVTNLKQNQLIAYCQ